MTTKKPIDPDNPPLTRAKMRAMRPVKTVLPGLLKTIEAERTRRGRPQKDVVKQAISLRLDPDILAGLDQMDGRRNTLINDILRHHLSEHGIL